MKLYKLTDANGRTKNATQWGEGDAAQPLCSAGWLHAYESPLLAVLLNPIHKNFTTPLLWVAEGEVEKRTVTHSRSGMSLLTEFKKRKNAIAFAKECNRTYDTTADAQGMIEQFKARGTKPSIAELAEKHGANLG